LAGTSCDYAVVTFSGPLALVSGPSLKIDNLLLVGWSRTGAEVEPGLTWGLSKKRRWAGGAQAFEIPVGKQKFQVPALKHLMPISSACMCVKPFKI
jgi:hypothetical protein